MAQTEKSAGTGRIAGRSHRNATVGRSSVRPDDLSECGDLDPALSELFEQVSRWLEAGENVDAEQLAAQHPEWAGEIRALLPALRGMAQAGQLDSERLASSAADDRDREGRRVVGDFHIVREIGRGGMGIVYEATQSSLGRRVALKILPLAAALDPRAIQRFQLEAQVAGWLQHPRIVPVHAVGSVDQVPYFAMQLIDGGSLGTLIGELRGFGEQHTGDRVDQSSGGSPSSLALGLLTGRFSPSATEAGNDRSCTPAVLEADKPSAKSPPSIRGSAYLRSVVRLGIQAAQALGYAHDQGIIHRDIKPANLLLDRHGDLWVADFGMADVQGDAGLTLSGDLPGTLRYMSPEQATGQRALVDRRTDIYSLGATLYELLTLEPAVAGSDKVEIIRRIDEEEPAPIRRLNPAVPVDLATIVTKAISKNPANRYETALKLADDLERFLDGRPIAARPVGPLRRTWRWCLRKPVQASLAAALILAIVGGFVGITWNWREAVVQRQEALGQKREAVLQRQEAERQKGLLVISQGRAEASEKKALTLAAKADAINTFLIEKLLRQASPEKNPAAKQVTLLEVLDHAADEVGNSLHGQPEIEAAIRVAIGETYHDLGAFAKSEAHFRTAHEIYARSTDETDEERVNAMSGLGHILVHLGRLNEAEPLLVEAAEECRRRLGGTNARSLDVLGYLATLRQEQGRYSDAEGIQRRLVDNHRLAGGLKDPKVLTAMNNLGTILVRERKYGEAERLFRECMETRLSTGGPRQPEAIMSLYNLGFVLTELGRVEEAEPLIRESFESSRQVLGPEHPSTLQRMSLLGSILSRLGRLDEAEKLLRPCLEAQRRVHGANDRESMHTAGRLDAVVKERARAAKAKVSAAHDASKP
jgi:serine/threonine protein kinase